jgi:hypothetical protein
MAEEELHRAEVAGLTIKSGRTPHRVRAAESKPMLLTQRCTSEHIGGLIGEDWHEVGLGKDVGNQLSGALVARLQQNSLIAR